MQDIHVLIVDDNMIVRSKYKKILSASSDLLISEAENGQKAIDIAKQKKPDIVIMDYMMPVMNGLKASQQIIMMYPDVFIIVSTGLEKKELTEAMLTAGAVMLMHKPISKNLLKLTIENFADIIRQKKAMSKRLETSISERSAKSSDAPQQKESAKKLEDTGHWKKTLSPDQLAKMQKEEAEHERIANEAVKTDTKKTLKKRIEEKPLTKIEERLLNTSTDKGISATEFSEKYMDEYEEEIKEIMDICDQLDEIVHSFSKTQDSETAKVFKANVLKLSKILNIFREFPSMIYALNSIASFLDQCEYEKICNTKGCRLSEILSEVNDLVQRWRDNVIAEQSADNINFIDNLILVYSLQLDTILENIK